MVGGYAGRIAFVDLFTGEIKQEKLDESLARGFIGGYGLGVRILFQRQKAEIDPLGPENILGFITGPLTGTHVPSGGRYTVVCKSPLTGGWGDANSGGFFGNELKLAGWDAIFFSGIASSPKYLLVTNERLELRDASHLWGRDTTCTEDILRKDLGDAKIKVAAIGQASEKLSLISGIVNDKGRVAARSGVGAVMGSKRLKALAVRGKGRVVVADKERVNQLRGAFLKQLRESCQPLYKDLMDLGTCGLTERLIIRGATPIKNWLLAGKQAFPNRDKISGDSVIKYQVKKFGCSNCPIVCGGIVSVSGGSYPTQEVHKPEYETIAAFGPMCLNDDLASIIRLNDICNRSGLDTISAGTVIAFAMECYERGIISKVDTDGIELSWGNTGAIMEMISKIIRREGFGDILADGVKVAAQKIGKGAEQYAMQVGGQEPGLHNPLYLPSRATAFVCDPTPGRHTAGSALALIDTGQAVIAPYPELQLTGFKRYEYRNKGPASAKASCYWQVGTCAGLCLFPVIFFGNFPLLDFLNAVTGWGITITEALQTGARIQTLRQLFNIREGIRASEVHLPGRMAGMPPKSEEPLAGITIDVDSLAYRYYEAMGWDPETGCPTDATLERLGLRELVGNFRQAS